MSVLTTLARMWMTRSVKPFTFTNEYDERLSYEDCEQLGLYVHIPFCRKVCDFCPYCKEVYDAAGCDAYIDALLEEIRMVGAGSAGKRKVSSLYFGGGTPALAIDRIGEIIDTLRQYYEITEGIGIELHPENVSAGTLKKLKDIGVSKISIGIQSFSKPFQRLLGRSGVDEAALYDAFSSCCFETVSMDFIFALPGQSFEDLRSDIDTAFAIGANHIAIYPFIDFDFTKSKVPAMDRREKRELLDRITLYCEEKGYARDSIWTFSKESNAKYSSMTRDNFLGFGCSATTLLKDSFKVNTFDPASYKARIAEGKLPTSLTIRFTERQRMVYYLFWKLYSTRLDANEFGAFFGKPLSAMYGLEFALARLFGLLKYNKGKYEMTLKGAFEYHHYENYYTLAYIDKMWGIMKDEPFPEIMVL